MDAELYIDQNTLLHRLDPRTKIIICLVSIIDILLFTNPLWMLPAVIFILVRIVISRAYINLYKIRMILIFLAIFTLILWNFFQKGTTPLFLFITVESLQFSIARALLILSMIAEGMILISTTRTEELVLGLVHLGLPYRVGFAFSTALRLVPTIASGMQTIDQAQRSRGLDLGQGNIIQRMRNFIPMVIPVFVTTLRNTNTFGMALESKGFGAKEKRTSFLELHLTWFDYFMLAFYLLFTLLCILVSILGYGHMTGLA